MVDKRLLCTATRDPILHYISQQCCYNNRPSLRGTISTTSKHIKKLGALIGAQVLVRKYDYILVFYLWSRLFVAALYHLLLS